MHVTVAIDARFDRTPDGDVWTDGWARHSFWLRYLMVFDEVRVLARVRDVSSVPGTFVRCTGPGVDFAPIPHYLGPWQYALRYPRVRSAVRRTLAAAEAVVLRAPATVANLAEAFLRPRGRPYGVEVVGDPLDVFSSGSVQTILRPMLRVLFTRALRRQCRGSAASYVTASTLQRRYPASAGVFSTSYSSIDMPDEAYVDAPRPIRTPSRPAGRVCRLAGTSLQGSRFVDRGRRHRRRQRLRSATHRRRRREASLGHGIVGCRARRRRGVRFVGNLPSGKAIRDELDQADLFVLPSRAEGLPRALIEAMARALPCLSTGIGGIPELLSVSELVPAGDAPTLATRMCGARRYATIGEIVRGEPSAGSGVPRRRIDSSPACVLRGGAMRPRFAYSPGVQYDSIVMVLRPPSPMATTPSRRARPIFQRTGCRPGDTSAGWGSQLGSERIAAILWIVCPVAARSWPLIR